MNFDKFYTYDIETFPNVFTISVKHLITGRFYRFEISDRINQFVALGQFLSYLSTNDMRMVGFNNIQFDYPVIHWMINLTETPTALSIYNFAITIINDSWENRFNHIIWRPYIEQIDLLKINHFDNVAKMTSLKMLEFNMRLTNIKDLPFPPGTFLRPDQLDELVNYNDDDVIATEQFLMHNLPAIEFREELGKKYGKSFINHNNGKIGNDILIMALEKAVPGCCFDTSGPRKKPRQTIRENIALKDVIFPYIKFDHPEFNRILDYFNAQVITETKGVFTDLTCVIDGFVVVFGLGGIHASIESTIVRTDEKGLVRDADVTSYYPNLAIKNRKFPEHLNEIFCDIYEGIFEERKKHKKGTPENLAYKEALNIPYGKSNEKFSSFFDSKYTMTITINGQLLLCMLAEKLMVIPGLKMIQMNTDGLTVKCPHEHIPWYESICDWWQNFTKLNLEYADYSRMMIRDVNSYIAEYQGTGKLKNKSAYLHDLAWHQNHSSLIVPKAAEAALVHGTDIREFITNHENIYDFCLRTKVNRNCKLVMTDELKNDHQLQNISRYYISRTGMPLTKIMPPLKKNPEKWRRIGIAVGWKASECNDITKFNINNLNYEYYIKETEKIVNPLLGGSQC